MLKKKTRVPPREAGGIKSHTWKLKREEREREKKKRNSPRKKKKKEMKESNKRKNEKEETTDSALLFDHSSWSQFLPHVVPYQTEWHRAYYADMWAAFSHQSSSWSSCGMKKTWLVGWARKSVVIHHLGTERESNRDGGENLKEIHITRLICPSLTGVVTRLVSCNTLPLSIPFPHRVLSSFFLVSDASQARFLNI